MLKSLLSIAGLLLVHSSLAQSASTFMGARSTSMGNTTSCLANEWSVFNNIGGLSKVTETTAAFTYESRPALKYANRMAAVITTPLKLGVAGLGVFNFGNNLYSEQIASFGYSNSFGITSLGANVNYIQYNATGFGSKGVFGLSLGALTQLTPNISIGTYAVNINQPKISSSENERLPALLIVGLGFTPTDKLFIITEIEKNIYYKSTWKGGIEYQVHKKVFFRTGFNIHPEAGFFGLGLRPKKFNLDYAYQWAPNLGPCHQASVGYKFKSK